MWKSAQDPLVGSGVKNLMYSHETEQPYQSWYLILNVFKLVNQSFYSLITTEIMVFSLLQCYPFNCQCICSG